MGQRVTLGDYCCDIAPSIGRAMARCNAKSTEGGQNLKGCDQFHVCPQGIA
jgi:hypothetical protein